MESFARNQEQMREYMTSTFGDIFPLRQFEEMSRQNLAMFQQAMNFFGPLGGSGGEKPDRREAGPEEKSGNGQLDELREKLTAMERQLDALAKKK
jgi:polyhydroxyalkanoate synthesis regulator protein